VTTSAKLTPAQRRILEAASRHMFGRIVGGDERTREVLRARGLIEPDGFLGLRPLFKVTGVGRQAVGSTHHATKKTPPAQLDREIAQAVDLGLPVEVMKKWRSKVAAYKRAVASVEASYTDEGHLKMARTRDALDKMIYEAGGHVPYVPGHPAYESEPIRALQRERDELVSSTWAQAQEHGHEANYRRYREESKRLQEEEREARRPYEWMRR